MTKKNFCKSVSTRCGLTATQVEKVLAAVAAVAGQELAVNDEVRVPGLVVLRAKQQKERAARNPRTGEPCMIPAGRRLSAKLVKPFATSVSNQAPAE